MAKYSIFIRPDLTQVFWARMQAGDFISEAVAVIETSRRTGRRILTDAGSVRPRRGRDLNGRCSTFAEREDIADPDLRAIHCNTLIYIVVSLAAVLETMRQILMFYKGELAVFTMTAKNDDIARTSWQSDGPALYSDESIQPPG